MTATVVVMDGIGTATKSEIGIEVGRARALTAKIVTGLDSGDARASISNALALFVVDRIRRELIC